MLQFQFYPENDIYYNSRHTLSILAKCLSAELIAELSMRFYVVVVFLFYFLLEEDIFLLLEFRLKALKATPLRSKPLKRFFFKPKARFEAVRYCKYMLRVV